MVNLRRSVSENCKGNKTYTLNEAKSGLHTPSPRIKEEKVRRVSLGYEVKPVPHKSMWQTGIHTGSSFNIMDSERVQISGPVHSPTLQNSPEHLLCARPVSNQGYQIQ